MSWTTIEQSQTGEVQYMIADLDLSLIPVPGTTNSASLNVSGYTKGTYSYDLIAVPSAGESLTIQIHGSNDGTTYFPICPSTVLLSGSTTGAKFLTWSIPVEFVRFVLIKSGGVATPIASNFMMLSAGSSAIISGNGGGNISAAGKNKEIQFNDETFFAGAPGALYDKLKNVGTGQIQLDTGTTLLPMLAFSDGTHPAGNYDTGIYRDEVDKIGFSAAGVNEAKIFENVSSVSGMLNLSVNNLTLAPGSTFTGETQTNSVYLINNSVGAGNITIQDLVPIAPNSGFLLYIITIIRTATNVVILHNTGGANGFLCPDGLSITLAGNNSISSAAFIYRKNVAGISAGDDDGRWVCIAQSTN